MKSIPHSSMKIKLMHLTNIYCKILSSNMFSVSEWTFFRCMCNIQKCTVIFDMTASWVMEKM